MVTGDKGHDVFTQVRALSMEVKRVRGSLGCLQRRAGKQEVAGACARASGTRPPAYWQEVEDGGDRGGLGRTVLDQHRSWAGSGGLHR